MPADVGAPNPPPTPIPPRSPALDPAALALALAAALWHGLLLTRATNDNFLHLTLAQQLLAGDRPVRDFFEHGWVLQYVLSAAAQLLVGHRLLSEAIVVSATWAISTYLVFVLVRRLTGMRVAAALSAVLLIVAGARGYSYPKGIVYAVAAVLWWGYVRTPSMRRAMAFGAWAAVACYWRPDHGVIVAIGIVLAMLAAHGLQRLAVTRTVAAGAAMTALMLPFVLYVQGTVGLADYVRSGIVQLQVEHTAHSTHDWPLLRFGRDLVVAEPPDRYAPRLGIRWADGSAADTRRLVRENYGLTTDSVEPDGLERVVLSAGTLPRLRALLNEPSVEDTTGIERSTAAIPDSAWPAGERRRFERWWLRLIVLPALRGQERASEFTVAVFYLVTGGLLVFAPLLSRLLPGRLSPWALALFALFALLVNLTMLRSPFSARAPDAVVLAAIAFGCCIAGLWRAGGRRGWALWLAARATALLLTVAAVSSVAGAGEFDERLRVMTGDGTSMRRARAAWTDVSRELFTSPPIDYFQTRAPRVEIRLAEYARACVPAGERLLVLWFAPDIYYYSERLMAQRHLVFVPGWSALEHEQRRALDKVQRFAPPIAFARRSALDRDARASYPGVVGYVDQEYELAGSLSDNGEEYLVLARRDRTPSGQFGEFGWPCFDAGSD